MNELEVGATRDYTILTISFVETRVLFIKTACMDVFDMHGHMYK